MPNTGLSRVRQSVAPGPCLLLLGKKRSSCHRFLFEKSARKTKRKAVRERDSWFQYQLLAYSLTANHQVRLGKCSREFLCDLLKPAGLKDDLRLGVADDIAGELFAFYD
jgi:hypothetical protein